MRYFSLALIVILALAVYRVTRVVTVDKISDPWRKWLYAKVQNADPDHRSVARWAYTLLTCPFCVSVYGALLATAFAVWLILPTWPGVGEFLVAWVAIAGAVALMASADARLNRE